MSLQVSSLAQQGATSISRRDNAAGIGVRQAAANPPPDKTQTAQQQASATQDKVSLGQSPAPTLTYSASGSTKTAQSELSQALEESERQVQAVMDLIVPMLEQQGLNVAKVISGEQRLDADPAAIEAAQAAIAEGGELSVEKTAERILSFAKSIISADPSRFDAVRGAVEQGFEEAQRILGGTLPEISQKTHTAVQAEFQRWKDEGINEG